MASAVFCTTINEARGLARAAYEQGLDLGKFFHYCTWDSGQEAALEIPSITNLKIPAYDAYIQRALRWLDEGDAVLQNKYFIAPDLKPMIEQGESTGIKSRTKVNVDLPVRQNG